MPRPPTPHPDVMLSPLAFPFPLGCQVMWVEQLPPGLARDPRRRCVEAFRRFLFAPGSGPPSLKMHLAKLMASEGDLICDAQGRPVDFGALPLGEGGLDGGNGGGLTYDQMHQVWRPGEGKPRRRDVCQ